MVFGQRAGSACAFFSRDRDQAVVVDASEVNGCADCPELGQNATNRDR
jgi:hypothetical protein